MLRLIVAKHVELHNFRLKLFFNVIQISTLVLLCIRFFEARLWVRNMPINDHMSAELWVSPGDSARLSEVWREKLESPICESPELFDFSWGGEDGLAFAGHACLPPCGAAGAAGQEWPRCVHGIETHRRESEDQVFFVTQFEERTTAADGTSDSSFAFVPLEEAHSLALNYGYTVPYPWWPGSFSASQLQNKMPTIPGGDLRARSDGYGEGSDGILTVLLDSDGNVHRVVEPRPVLHIPLPELLELVGERDAVDTPNEALGPNSHEGAQHPEGGLGRITGVNIDLHIECFQSQRNELPGREPWLGPVCYGKAERSTTRTWASWELVENLGSGGSVRHRLHHGIRARVVMEGHVDVFDANSLFLQLTASLVFLALPNQFMYFFINYTLGHLSTIYQGVLIELFDVQMECARLTARLMSNSVSFVELEDVAPTKQEDVGCISRLRVDEQLREVLRYRGATLDEEEIAGVVHFCHEAVMHSETLCRRVKPLNQLRAALADSPGIMRRAVSTTAGTNMQVQPLDPGVITIDAFSMCCAASSQLEFESFVRLFDKDRGVTVLEYFFLPPKLKPATLLRKGQQCNGKVHSRHSLFNLHQRHETKMEMLHSLRGPSALSDSRPTTSDVPHPVTGFSLHVPLETSPIMDMNPGRDVAASPSNPSSEGSPTRDVQPGRPAGKPHIISEGYMIGAVDVDDDDFSSHDVA